MPVLARAKGQPEQAPGNRERIDPDRVGQAGTDHRPLSWLHGQAPTSAEVVMGEKGVRITQKRIDI